MRPAGSAVGMPAIIAGRMSFVIGPAEALVAPAAKNHLCSASFPPNSWRGTATDLIISDTELGSASALAR
jgi:hypothetical protein